MSQTPYVLYDLLPNKCVQIYKVMYTRYVSLVAQMVKNLPAMQEPLVPTLSPEDSLGKGIATHSSILAWRIPWTEELAGLQSMYSLFTSLWPL